MTCPITEEISKYADEPEARSASETLDLLELTDVAYINDELFDKAMVTDKVDVEAMRSVIHELSKTNPLVRRLYIDTISELSDD